MKVSSSKGKILKNIREALSNPVPLPFPKSEGNSSIFQPQEKELDILFAEEFSKLLGKFAFCLDEEDAKNQIQILLKQGKLSKIYCAEEQLKKYLEGIEETTDLANCDAAITSCHYLVARTGSIVLSSALKEGRTASVYAPIHICIAYTHQLVFDTKDAIIGMKQKFGEQLPSSITFAAGPSRTADIEKTLVVGVHGPKEVYVFMIDEPFES
ncbi:MAG: lactate utilization protein [Ginsengibacter sp.]|jgi:L-lactate dehydrogenase complex protein LldG